MHERAAWRNRVVVGARLASLGDIPAESRQTVAQLLDREIDDHHLAGDDLGGELGAIALRQAVFGQVLATDDANGTCGIVTGDR